MDDRQKAAIMELGIKRILFDCPMDQFTTFRVGGPANAVCFPKEINQVQTLVKWLNKESLPYLLVGRGSNLLVNDEGLNYVVIILEGSLATIEKTDQKERLLVGGGLSIVELLSHCSALGLAGVEFMAGIPGTVGGAVIMNAGAFGAAIGDRIQDIQIITSQGEWVTLDQAELQFSYRGLRLPQNAIVVKALIQLIQEDTVVIRERIRDYLSRRKASQPLEFPSGGSVFKNPPNHYAGKLIEQSGLKGKKIGGAAISAKHANFIVNTGDAKAADIVALMELAREKVKKDSGIDLESEIRIVG